MASGDAIKGPIEVGPRIIPPYGAIGPKKTREEVEACCGEFITEASLGLGGTGACDSVCSFNVRRYVKVVMRKASDGSIIAQTARFDILAALTNTALASGAYCAGASLISPISPVPDCPALPFNDLLVGVGCSRVVFGADTFSTPSISVIWVGTAYSITDSSTPSSGWTGPAVVPIAGPQSFYRTFCGETDFLRSRTKGGNMTIGMGGPSPVCPPINIELWIEPA